MQKITWEIQFLSLPPVKRYCKKCGKKIEFLCSHLFRVNAQQKCLDIWLIYKCSKCDSTWNSTVFTRVNPKNLNLLTLEGFYNNDPQLVEQIAMNTQLLQQNGTEPCLPDYQIIGELFDLEQKHSSFPIQLHIISKYPTQFKVSALLREKLGWSRKTLELLVNQGRITGPNGVDLMKCRLKQEIIIEIKA